MDDSVIVISSDEEDVFHKPVKTEVLDSKYEDSEQGNPLARKIAETPQNKRKTESIEVESCVVSPKKQKLICEENNKNNSDDSSAEVVVELMNCDSSVLSEFISSCLKLDSSSTMKKILNGKMKKYYSCLNPDYQKSEQFYSLLERKQAEIERCPSYLYRHLKDVVDEMNSHRIDNVKNNVKPKASDHFIRKLCKAMELLHRKIKNLEEKEVDWDEDEDSSYLQLQRYRERFIKVHDKLQELEGTAKTIFKRKISFSGTKFPSINRAVEKFVNVKGEFPDYHDIVDLLKKAYESEGIEVTPSELKFQAKSVFENVGEQLQRQRQYECWETHSSFLEADNDPAEENDELRAALDDNKRKYGSRIDEVINSFVVKHTKNQSISEDSNSSNGINQNQFERKEENSNANLGVEKEKMKGDDIKSKESEEKGENGEREHCEEKYNNGCDDGNDKKCEEEEGDKEDEEEEEEEEEDDEEEEANGNETMADILDDLNKEQGMEYEEQLFLYHGPVSPPKLRNDHELNIDSLSPLPSPVPDSNAETENEKHESEAKKTRDNLNLANEGNKEVNVSNEGNKEVNLANEENKEVNLANEENKEVNLANEENKEVNIANEEKVQEATASCSNWKDTNASEPIQTSSESPKSSSENKTFLKLKPLSSLLRKSIMSEEQNEILID